LAIEQIVFARNYTLGLLDQIKIDDWFRIPPGKRCLESNHPETIAKHVSFT
jgi:hypothetical protein